MTATYDPSTDVGRVRLLISDVGGADSASFLFQDAEIETFLDMSGSIKGAAIEALRAIAGNEAQVQKRITFLELKTDGPAVAKELRELAKDLEASLDIEEGDGLEIARIGKPSYGLEYDE
jgi:hypothetical protein